MDLGNFSTDRGCLMDVMRFVHRLLRLTLEARFLKPILVTQELDIFTAIFPACILNLHNCLSTEGNEVYESNHETTLAAGLIHGPCKLLPPRKFYEERVIQTHSQTTTFDRPNMFFLCKWFYYEKKRVFRDVTC
ncbi:hypothetical protein L1987_02437 [Smallanthus sonchifolius]|uniref:Uncharacterized protein n=1 Tax=Smallanthus sonchifolius TaxID=185202 RepID=A0ACB9K7U4_9ASTR|nr:hypothetical protein L1987_02437 [Smallanthus sonchifolius]